MIVHSKTTKETAELLAQDLGVECLNPHKTPIVNKAPIVIRWGQGTGLGYKPEKVINKQTAVNTAVHKLKSIKLFKEAGVRTAEFTTHVPCVGRSIEHTQGQNFWLCWQADHMLTSKMEGAEYFIEYIPIKQEYRVHVIDGTIAFTQRKYPQNRISSAFMGIQGFSSGWHKHVYDGEVHADILNTAISAVKCLGLDFGGVDILINLNNDLPYVAEVNTGPSLPTPEVRKFYVEYFKTKLGL